MRAARVRAFAPATIANLGPGFDVLGLALERPGDLVTAVRRRAAGLVFSLRGRADLPRGARNVAAHCARLLIEDQKPGFGVEVILHKGMPVGSGLGSSAASSVAAVVAVNALLPRPLCRMDLLRFAVEGERLASGAPHADNAAASLLGGVCLVRRTDPLDVIRLPVAGRLVWTVVHPHVVLATRQARRLLPARVALADAVRQWADVGALVAGLSMGDAALVGRALGDGVAEPVRAPLIPAFHAVRQAALGAGALGGSISGSGPSVFAVSPGVVEARAAGRAMAAAFRKEAGLASDVFISGINRRGARLSWLS